MRPVPLTAFRLVLALALVPAAVAAAGSAHAAPAGAGLPLIATVNVTVSPDVSIYQDSYVPKGQVHDGDLVSLMGDVRVEGEVTGQVVVVMGSLDLSGTVRGDVVSVMSRTTLSDTADVGGQLVGVGWSIQRAMGSKVGGQVVNVGFMNLLPFAGHGGGLSGIIRFFFILHLIKLTFLFVILLVITALMPRRLSIIAAAFPEKWGWGLLVGLLTYCGVLIGVFILAVTIIGLPLAFALWYLAKGIKWVGLASIFYLVGQTAGRNLFRRELPHLASVLGGFVVYALMTLVPGLGWAFNLILSMMALGLALVTRLGGEPVPGAQPAGASPASGARVTGDAPIDPSGVGVPPLVS
ncbi:MAG TPA: hypothetical protein VFB95_04280 [Candidatus Cryosericum sp.]|nr:hypothetical protein [Candidatus Cryosericum sp.]